MKILYLGDSPAVATGLGVVGKNILNGLIKIDPTLDITVIGINDRGAWKDNKEYPYKIYPAIYDNYYDLWGAIRLINTLRGEEPEIKGNFDVLIINSDFFLLDTIKVEGKAVLDWLKDLLPHTSIKKTILYTPIDNDYLNERWLEILSFFSELAVPSYYAKTVIKRYDPQLAKRTHVIYYGLDTENFYPKPKEDNKRFTIGYVGRNQWRKDLCRLISIFADFKKTHSNAFLHIHTTAEDDTQNGWNIFELLHHYGLYLYKDYYVPIKFNQNKGLERKSMNDIYNSFDVFLSCSTGEGFGLPYAEASLCEVPLIIPDNTVADEFKDYCYVYRNITEHSFGWIDNNRIRKLGDPADALEKLNYVYKNRDEAKKKAKKAREFFLQFTYERMAREFYKLLQPL